MLSMMHSTASFLRWRLVPVRYLGRLPRLRPKNLVVNYTPKQEKAREIEKTGYATGPTFDPVLVKELQDIYFKRGEEKKGDFQKAPFVNLSREEDFTAFSPLLKVAFSPGILDVALDYYSGHCRLDKLQVLYSFASDTEVLKESQKWHLDYSDSRSFHAITYVSDVLNEDAGPFVYVDKEDTKRIGKGIIIRRIEDDQFRKEMGPGEIRSFFGNAGETVLVDPAVCYHYGSRCKVPRIAIFTTFSSDKPYAGAMPLIQQNRGRLLEAAKKMRPDINPEVLARLVDV